MNESALTPSRIENIENNMPTWDDLKAKLEQSSKLIDDIILKKYLHGLTKLEIMPLSEELKEINLIRIFKITEMVYQKDEYSTYKFASVFGSLQNLDCGVFIIADSNGEKTDFYMGVRSLDNKHTASSLKNTLKNALSGQFPGIKAVDLDESKEKSFLSDFSDKNVVSVSCVANNKDDDFKNNETFIQGLEKLALAMQGQKYTAIVLAKSAPLEQLDEIRLAYETIYTQLSPFANMQLSYGRNEALSISDALSHGTTTGTSYTKSTGIANGTTYSKGSADTESLSKADKFGTIAKAVGSVALSAASIATAPLTGGASIAAAGLFIAGRAGLALINTSTETKGTSKSESYGKSETKSEGEAFGRSESTSDSQTRTEGTTSGLSENMQLTLQNKTLLDTLDRIDLQLKRLDECESLGMWECAAYFLSDSQETAEMAAGTYKSLMKGAKSGVETSAVNLWKDKKKCPMLRDYITNFIHPVFLYKNGQESLAVTAASLLSSNEMAIQMGLPRKSVCGFPVIEHADFGKEVISYAKDMPKKHINLGKIFNMGAEAHTDVRLDADSLAMHSFITGSTGSGKSNTVYEILNQIHTKYKIPFLVIEPAKGEYKDVFGGKDDVNVYSTNPKKAALLRLNPFSFPDDTHVLEHIDRLVEVLNACWPMYAAMPAVLKAAIENAYIACGWDLHRSESYNEKVFPTFHDVMKALPKIVDTKGFSNDTQGDYKGALLTRLESLTNGINGQVLCAYDELSNADLFDKNVIVDLSRVGSMETKALLMGILVLKLQEYRMAKRAAGSDKSNNGLQHVTVLEEAHNLLRRTGVEQVQESSNLQGKSVEMLTNAIAEMRTYGEGFIIADQAPGLLDMAAIRNTNTKIILRLPDESDRVLVGRAAGLNDNQITELSKLDTGVAAVYQNGWLEPVLCKVSEFKKEEMKPYVFAENSQESVPFNDMLFRWLLGEVDTLRDLDMSRLKVWLQRLDIEGYEENSIREAKSILITAIEQKKLPSKDKVKPLTEVLTEGQKLFSDCFNHPNPAEYVNLEIRRKLQVTRETAGLLQEQVFLSISSRLNQEESLISRLERARKIR